MTRSKAADLFFSTLALVGAGDLWIGVATFGFGYLTGLGANRILTLRLGLPSIQTGSLIVDGSLFYLLYSFFFYWNHRLFHTRLFWTLHRFHHSATEMLLFNAVRHHPLHQATERLIMVWPVAITGIRPDLIILIMALHSFQQLLTHANLPHGWGWFGSWVFQSPLLHRVHHAKDSNQANRNFGALMLWDHIFGTYAPPVEDIPIGIKEDLHNRRLFIFDLVADAVDFARALIPSSRARA